MMKYNRLIILLLAFMQQGYCQLLGVSVNPQVDAKIQFPITNYPLKTGTGYSSKLFVNLQWFYVIRGGAGIGFTQFSHPEYIDPGSPVGVKKIKTKWNNLCVPFKLTCILPIAEIRPFGEFEASIVIPQRIVQTQWYDNHTREYGVAYDKGIYIEKIFRLGGMIKGEKHDLAFSAQTSFIENKKNNFQFFALGLSVQYYFTFYGKKK